jgi:hypothetical protein
MASNRPGGDQRNTSPWECPRCLALPGQPCTYTTSAGIHRAPVDGRWRYVDNVPGEPMTRMHRARPRITCLPINPADWQ